MPTKGRWADVVSRIDNPWQDFPNSQDLDDVRDVQVQLAKLCMNVIQYRLEGLDIYMTIGSNRAGTKPLVTVRLAGEPKYAGGEDAADFAKQLAMLNEALQTALLGV